MTLEDRAVRLLRGAWVDRTPLFPFILGFCARNAGYPVATIYRDAGSELRAPELDTRTVRLRLGPALWVCVLRYVGVRRRNQNARRPRAGALPREVPGAIRGRCHWPLPAGGGNSGLSAGLHGILPAPGSTRETHLYCVRRQLHHGRQHCPGRHAVPLDAQEAGRRPSPDAPCHRSHHRRGRAVVRHIRARNR